MPLNLNIFKANGEDHSTHFFWTFRACVASAKEYDSGLATKKFYKDMTNEINLACESHKIDCYPLRHTYKFYHLINHYPFRTISDRK